MSKYNYTFSEVDINSISEQDSLSVKDASLVESFTINSKFDQLRDFIELHYYSLDGRLLLSNPRYTNIQSNQDSETANKGTLGTISLRTEEDLVRGGFEFGDVYLLYNFLNNPYTDNTAKSEFYIEEISPDRLEIRLVSTNLEEEYLKSTTTEIKNSILDPDKSDFYVNLGENRLLLLTNIDTLPYRDFTSIVVRLYNPLPEDLELKTTVNINEKVCDPIGYRSFAELIVEEEKLVYLKGPNFSMNVEENTEQPSQYFNIDELFGYPVTNSYYEVKSSFEEKGAELSIDHSNYSNFINFSSAQDRLANFKYKLDLIQLYQSQSNSITSANYNSAGVTGSKDYFEGLINNMLSNFDHYDRFLYYESSSFSWPKEGLNKPYTLVTGSAGTNWYNNQILSASFYDSTNPYSLENTIPEFLREDPNNSNYLTFIHMIGQHFDNLWIYSKAVSEKYNSDNRLNYGISKDLIQDALKNFGVKLYSSNKSTQELFKIFTGDFYELSSEEFGNRLNSATIITGSNQSTSEEDYRKEIYKRLYHNLPLLNKTKGTERGIRALLSTFGVPSLYSSGSHSGLNVLQTGGAISGSFNLGGSQYFTSSLGKIRTDNTGSTVEGDTLSPYISIVKQDTKKYSKDYNFVEVGFSPSNYINNLIIASASLESFDIDSILGDPRFAFSSSYDTLATKTEEYLASITGSRYDLNDFIRVLKFYDNVLFKTVSDFLPARSNISTGVIIKPHLLERSKTKQVKLSSTDYEHLEGSYNLTVTSSYSEIKKQFTGDITLSGSIDIGNYTGSNASAFGGNNNYTASYTSSIITPDGLATYNYHNHEEATYDGEFSGSNIVITDGELNRDNTFKYFIGTTLQFVYDFINADADCRLVWGEFIPTTPSPNTPAPAAAPTPPPNPACETMSNVGVGFTSLGEDENDACSQVILNQFGSDSTDLSTATILYSSTLCISLASPGHYAQGGVYRYWDGAQFTGAAVACPTPAPQTPAPQTPAPASTQQWSDFYVHTTEGNGDSSEITACGQTTLSTRLYFTSSVGDFSAYVTNFGTLSTLEKRVYNDDALTDPFAGGALWYGADQTGLDTSYALFIQSNGDVGVIYDCDSTPAPTATPTFDTLILYASASDGTGWDTGEEACANTGTAFFALYYAYGDSITNTTLHTDTDLLLAFNGNLKWYSHPSSTYAIKIAADGTTSSDPNWYISDCSATPSPTEAPTPAPTAVYSYTTFFDASSELTACATATPDDTVYSSCSTITTTCVLYYNSDLTGQVANGYYHDTTTGDYYYVEGGGVVNEVGSCAATPAPTPSTPAPLACNSTSGVITSLVSAEDTCSGTTKTVYHNGATGLSDATIIFTAAGCGTVQSSTVWINDQSTYYEWDGNTLTQISAPNCP